MGRPKANLTIGEETFLGRLARIYGASCDPVIVVLGHDPGGAILERHLSLPVTFVRNPDPDRGMFSSLQVGLAETRGDAALFQPVDFPMVSAETVDRLARMEGVALAIPVFEGKRGHPVRLGAALMEEMRRAPAHGQARDLIRPHYGDAVFVEVDDPGVVRDIDTPEEYARWAV